MHNHITKISIILLIAEFVIGFIYIKYINRALLPELKLKAIESKLSAFLSNYKTTIMITLFVISIILLWKGPAIQLEKYSYNLNSKELAELENAFRVTLVQILGGIVLFAGVYFTWRRVSATEKNVLILEEGQITERFTRAVEHLGSDKTEIRLGGIYALERIAKDSEKDHWSIMEILTAYIRENSPRKLADDSGIDDILPIEIRSIIEVINWRNNESENEHNVLDFSYSYLQYANFNSSKLKYASFVDSYIWGGKFVEADLERSTFLFAELNNSDLSNANLTESIFVEADLTNTIIKNASVKNAQFAGATFKNADCQKTSFEGTYFSNANFEEADLRETDFRKARGLSVKQLIKAKTLYEAKFDEDLLRQLKEKAPYLFVKQND
ncbi:Pentapeptide repeat-containing protein [Methanolobus vulcani]|uniref:Pentapeptide repeat-containing protein n=2 Tax=Methanolobus vulcani TaxID=38026 RepID=A0A7Z7AXP1_9EURY|nr:Pentapeptide repeat-containing protein [Methanolobus vulcani]